MTTLHPHWQSTDDADERSIPVRITTSEASPSMASDHRSAVKASRRPAAFVGIFLFLIAGAAALQGYGLFGLGGQLSQNDITIHLKSTGAEPVTVTVKPGATITWTNDDTIPHVLSSETLPTMDGKPFVTSAIFPGSSTHVLIPPTAVAGGYAYISQTSDMVSGQIIVQADNGTTVTPQMPATTPPVFQTSSAMSSAPAVISAPVTSLPESSAPPVYASAIPTNPYTVGSGNVPLPDRQQPGARPDTTSHIPATMPESGPAVWITVLMAVSLVLVLTRKAFRSL